MTPTLRALCSGYGGLELAVEAATGAVLVDHAEIDPAAARVHEAHWPGVPNLGDITAVDWAALEPTDILCAGFPCQPISQAGRRKVTNDARWLWPHIAHAVRVLRPRLVVLENVPPLLRPWEDDDGWWNPAPIEEVAGDLAALGYMGRWRCIQACDVGAPHRRDRVFVVGVATNPHNERCEGPESRALRHAGRGHRPTPNPVLTGAGRDSRAVPRTAEGARWAGVDVHAAVDGGAAAADADLIERGGEGHPEPGHRPTADVRRGTPQPGGRRSAPTNPDSHRLEGGGEPDSDSNRPGLPTPRRGDARGLGATAWGEYESAIRRWEHLTRPAPSPVDDKNRLAPEFSEWMMGLPAGWVTSPAIGLARTKQLHVIGNGVVPSQAAAALVELLEPLERAA